jgi:hypothetical protein
MHLKSQISEPASNAAQAGGSEVALEIRNPLNICLAGLPQPN